MCARQDCFVFERPQVVFYCNFSLLQTREQKRQSHWSDSFWRNQKNEPEAGFFLKWRFYVRRFSRRCAHSHWRPLFSHEALNVGPGVYGPILEFLSTWTPLLWLLRLTYSLLKFLLSGCLFLFLAELQLFLSFSGHLPLGFLLSQPLNTQLREREKHIRAYEKL